MLFLMVVVFSKDSIKIGLFQTEFIKKSFFKKCPKMFKNIQKIGLDNCSELTFSGAIFSSPTVKTSTSKHACIIGGWGYPEILCISCHFSKNDFFTKSIVKSPILKPSLENFSTIKNNIFQAPGPPGTLK